MFLEQIYDLLFFLNILKMTIRRMQNLGIAYMCLIITSCTFNNKQKKKTAEELSFFPVSSQADKKRKLYNGTLKVDLYQYFGQRVKRQLD